MLLARIREEQQRQARAEGLRRALEQTGSVFWGSGLIVAGVFAALMGGSLVALEQLGFALACGVLLDAFLLRPFLIPAGLLLASQMFEQTATRSPANPSPRGRPQRKSRRHGPAETGSLKTDGEKGRLGEDFKTTVPQSAFLGPANQ